MILALKADTNGLPLYNKPSDDPGQPHIVSLAMVLINPATRDVADAFHEIIRPDGWDIPRTATNVHRIDVERARRDGISETDAVDAYRRFQSRALQQLGWTAHFDRRIMRIGMFRAGIPRDQIENIENRTPLIEVMTTCTAICKLPPSDKMMALGRKAFKQPTLAEAVREMLGAQMEPERTAMSDLSATLALYWKTLPLREPTT